MMNPLTNRASSKHCTYFSFSCCLCFGIDLSGLISRDEDVRRGEEGTGRGEGDRERQREGEAEGEEMRPNDKGSIFVKV